MNLENSNPDFKSFAITLQIPAFKKIIHNKQNKPYKKYLACEQKQILIDALTETVDFFNEKKIQVEEITFIITYEEHLDKRIHAHICVDNLHRDLQNDFHRFLFNSLQFKKDNQLMNIVYMLPLNTFLDREQWIMYIKKHQNI